MLKEKVTTSCSTSTSVCNTSSSRHEKMAGDLVHEDASCFKKIFRGMSHCHKNSHGTCTIKIFTNNDIMNIVCVCVEVAG
jgi:hypothetical protein